MEFDAILTNARFEFEPRPHLHGVVWNDAKGRFSDGTVIHTSEVIAHRERNIFETRNTRYLVVFGG